MGEGGAAAGVFSAAAGTKTDVAAVPHPTTDPEPFRAAAVALDGLGRGEPGLRDWVQPFHFVIPVLHRVLHLEEAGASACSYR